MALRSEEDVAAEAFAATDPVQLFRIWFAEAELYEPNDANAMSLATVDENGLPDVRVVLLKDMDEDGFVFYTNLNSAKGEELLASRKAALNFHWKSLRRQVRVRGLVSKVPDAEADEYFATRPRGSQLGAWASNQSHPMESRDKLIEDAFALDKKYEGQDVPRPPHWSGFCVTPLSIEFWINREFRLHDRRVFRRGSPAADWEIERIYP
jgi:pyridoxamine 5'-phosphate oxidase